jgi:hypothetical protein
VARVSNLEALAAQEATDAEAPTGAPQWPELAPEARHGLAGRFVAAIEPHTEADPVALLIQFMTLFGNVIGRTAHFSVEADRHYLNLFSVLVGESSKGRKGVSLGHSKRPFETVDPDWAEHRIESGLSSGEGLIWAVRDPIEKQERIRPQGEPLRYETVLADPGVEDKRLVVCEAEFASVLRVLSRDGNTLSALIRKAWDTGSLSSLTKNTPARATGAHISIVGHVTRHELLHYLTSTEAGNGFGNRFLWCCVRRSKCLPEGGQASSVDLQPLISELGEAIQFARQVEEISRDDEARETWASVYPDLSEGRPGILGSMIARAEAQTMRLACIYALLDRSEIVRREHLLAALALWDFCDASARYIFGEALGNPVADEILDALTSSPEGMTRTEIRNLFSRNKRAKEVGGALTLLLDQNLAEFKKEPTGGRPTERWFATDLATDEEARGE